MIKNKEFTKSDKVFRRSYTVETYNAGYFQEIRLSDLFKYLQEVASQHSEAMKIGFDDLQNNQGAWVLTKQYLEVIRLPRALEKFTIHTWSHKHNKFIANRNFIVTDEADNLLIKVTSDWVVISLDKRKIIPLNKLNLDYIQSLDLALFTDPLQKIVIDDKSEIVNEFTKTVRFSDIDLNGHMNNTCYIDMVLDSCAEVFSHKKDLKSINTNFIQEVKLSDEILIQTYQKETFHFDHKIIRLSDKREVFTATTVWEK